MAAESREISIKDVVRILNDLNLRITPQRIIITKIILEHVKEHPSFKQIYKLVKSQMPSIGISTLFNTLKLLEQNNVITLFEFNGETHIDLPRPHVNVYCKNVDKIIDIEDEEVIEMVEKLIGKVSELGIKPFRSNIVIEAICPEDLVG